MTLIRLLGLALLMGPSLASALQAQMRVGLAGEAPYWVGQRIVITVDLLSTGFSFSQQRFDLPTLPGVLLLPPGSAGQNLSETIDGESWQGLRYRLSLLVLHPGEIDIPAFNVSFRVTAGYASEAELFSFASEPLRVTLRQPPGTENLSGVLSTPQFKLESQWQPGINNLKVGDALTLSVRRVATDVPGAAIAPLEIQPPAGLAVYPEAPEIHDRSNRGDLIGERFERISLVLQAPGDYQLPAIEFAWFDPRSQRLHREHIPALNFSVAANPDALKIDVDSSAIASVDEGSDWQALTLVTAGLAVTLFALWGSVPRVRGHWLARQARWRASEAGRFRALLAACGRDDPQAADAALLAWLASLDGRGLSVSIRVADHPELAHCWTELQEALIGGAGRWSGHGLAEALLDYRQQRDKTLRHRSHLPPLNPYHGSLQ